MKYLIISLLVVLSTTTYAQNKKEQIEILTNRVDSLNQVATSQSKTINDKNSQISGLNTKIMNLESSISFLNTEISILTSDLQQSEIEIATKAQEISNLKAQLKTKTDSLTLVFSELEKLKPAQSAVVSNTTTNQVTQTGFFKSVKIGTQTWMTENLNVSTFRNGDPIPHAKTDEEWKAARNNQQAAWCYYNNDPSNGTKYGKLYNWYAVNDPRGLAPNGFHIPSDAEWTILTDYLGGEDKAGTKMKSTSGWKTDGNGTNSSGFSGLPGGFRNCYCKFSNIDNYGYWWSNAEDWEIEAWSRDLNYSNGNVSRNNDNEQNGLSVRCIKD